MRELRHDFRRWYGCAYDGVPVDEAVDLVLTLPRGSLWRSSRRPHGEWTDELELNARIADEIRRFMHLFATGTTEGAQRAVRPEDMELMDAARARAAAVRGRMGSTEWEEVADGEPDDS